jgi:hypothetical protein
MPGWNGIIAASTLSLAMLAFTASGASAQHAEPPEAQFSRIANESTNVDEGDGEEEDQWWPGHARMAAGLASTIVPGGGQFFKGERGKGALMLTAFAAAITYAFTAGFSDQEICVGPSTQPHCTVATNQMNGRFLIGLGTAAGIQAWSIVDAFSPRRR